MKDAFGKAAHELRRAWEDGSLSPELAEAYEMGVLAEYLQTRIRTPLFDRVIERMQVRGGFTPNVERFLAMVERGELDDVGEPPQEKPS